VLTLSAYKQTYSWLAWSEGQQPLFMKWMKSLNDYHGDSIIVPNIVIVSNFSVYHYALTRALL